MATTKWHLNGSGLWDIAANWSPAAVPVSGDVVLDHSGLGSFSSPYSVTILATDPAYAIHDLKIASPGLSGYIALNLFGRLSASGTFTASGYGNQVNTVGGTFQGAAGSFGSNSINTLVWGLYSNATVSFTGLIAGSGIDFDFKDNTAGRLVFGNQGASFTGVIGLFREHNIIDLTKVAYGAGGFSATQPSNGQPLKILQGGHTVFTFGYFSFMSASVSSLVFSPDGSGGTILTVCFAAGTKIATDSGSIAVEHLRKGDRVVTIGSGAPVLQKVRWIGRRRLGLRGHPNPCGVAPVRICADAFADGVPQRDLVVSPDHAIYVDRMGGLIPARLLINHMSIRQETGLTSVEYFHVELDRHSILLAEGLPTESYLDTGNRGFFGNAGEPLVLHPDLVGEEPARHAAGPCVPFLTDEVSVRPVWQHLHDRAVAAGLSTEVPVMAENTGLRLLAGGREFLPVAAEAGRYVFTLPDGIDTARLVSHSAAPADANPWLDDRRRLGVAVERIQLRSADSVGQIAMDHPELSQGWWDVERTGTRLQRWTNGDAVIKLPGGPVLLELTVAETAESFLKSAVSENLKAA